MCTFLGLSVLNNVSIEITENTSVQNTICYVFGCVLGYTSQTTRGKIPNEPPLAFIERRTVQHRPTFVKLEAGWYL